jgi:diguanylate cyclase (GGDEF)-like protein
VHHQLKTLSRPSTRFPMSETTNAGPTRYGSRTLTIWRISQNLGPSALLELVLGVAALRVGRLAWSTRSGTGEAPDEFSVPRDAPAAFPKTGTSTEGPIWSHEATTPLWAADESFVRSRERELHTFWSSYLRLGLLVFSFESIGALVYLVLTPGGRNRILLIALSGTVLVMALGNSLVVDRIAEKHWRSRFSFFWTLLAGLLLTAVCYLDGGIDSPLVYLLVLPIASAALGLSVSAVLVCGFATLVELLFVWVSDPRVGRLGSDMATFSLVLVGLVIFAIGFARYRTRLQNEEFRLQKELALRAETDLLTGCLNHSAFYQRLSTEIDRALREHRPLSLLMLDIDLFKFFNDSYGHLAGDDALAEVGRALRDCSRSFDVVGRVGGDEFAVILPTTNLLDAGATADRVARTLEHPNGIQITVSVGYAELSPSEPNARQLVRDADAGLYAAKSDGRHRAASASSRRPDIPAQRAARGTTDHKMADEPIRASESSDG